MKKSVSLNFFIGFLLFCVTTILAQNERKISDAKNYKEIIVKNYYLFQKTESTRLLDSTLRFIKLSKFKIKEDTINSKVYYLEGVNNLFLKRFDRAEEYFTKSFELAQKTKDYLLMGTIYNSRGVTLSMGEKDYVKAEELYQKAIEYYKQINELPQQIDSYYNLTNNARKTKKWELCIKYAQACIDLIHKINKEPRG